MEYRLFTIVRYNYRDYNTIMRQKAYAQILYFISSTQYLKVPKMSLL